MASGTKFFRSTAMVFVVAELLSAVPATTRLGVLKIIVLFQREPRRKPPPADAATEGTIR
jgi:hypothetical protein